MKLRISSLLLISLLLLSLTAFAQEELRRKAALGIRPAPPSEESQGIPIQQVLPGGSAAQLGLQAGDILQSLNGQSLNSLPELFGQIQDLRADDGLKVTVLREGEVLNLKGKAVARPFETASETSEVIYDEVKFREGILRTIINRPSAKKGKSPAILFIPGYPCASYDNMPPIHPYKKLIDAFVEKGYVVMRVEKPGMGDGVYPTPCDQIDIATENAAFLAGYRSLIQYDFVDTSQVFIFGHSLGGISAPVVASEVKPRGVIVYGTAYEPWWEYLMRMLRKQNPMFGIDYVENEKDMRLYHQLLYEQYVLKRSPKELAAQKPEFGRLLERDFQWDGEDMIFGRHYRFWNGVNDLNLTEAWKNTEAAVLAIYGEADIEALDPGNHRAIADIINHYHPGKGTFHLLPGTNHSMIEVGSMAEGVKIQNSPEWRKYLQEKFNYQLIEYCDDWMKEQ